MKNIYLCDNSKEGHHYIYQKTLENINNTRVLNYEIKFCDIKTNIWLAYKERKSFIKYINKNSKEDSVISLLYLDPLYKCPLISRFFDENKKYVGTLHWVPNNFLYKKLLKKICKKLQYIIVHSEYLKNELNNIGIKNVIHIDYPSFLEEKKKSAFRVKNDKIILSCLGGTRHDKGLDLLIDSFRYIPDIKKDNLLFNICGIEQDIKYSEIIKSANKYNINIITKNRFLDDLEYEEEINKSDVILLPYKSYFSGNSGPMTDGIFRDKFILGPKDGNLGFLINKYNLGSTFISNNAQDLANEISKLCDVNLEKNHEYKKMLHIDSFLAKYESIYNTL